jgi:hypothetical protein
MKYLSMGMSNMYKIAIEEGVLILSGSGKSILGTDVNLKTLIKFFMRIGIKNFIEGNYA